VQSWYPAGIIKGLSGEKRDRMYHVKFDDGDDYAKLSERYVMPEDLSFFLAFSPMITVTGNVIYSYADR